MTEHIRINAGAPRIQYVADGAQTAFPFPFAIFQAADLQVLVNEAQQVGGLSVTGAGSSNGGTATFAAPPPAGALVTLLRRLTVQRVTDFQADGIIRAKSLNDELDYQIAALQQLADEIGHTVRRRPSSPSSADLTLPEPAAGRALKWNADGTGLVNTDHDTDVAGDLLTAADAAGAAQAAAETARDQAQAAVGGVRVSEIDPLAGTLTAKLAAGSGITLTEEDGALGRRLVIGGGMAQSVTDRLSFLELNLALNTLRDQIDAGWSVLKMVDGVADEFADETGVDVTASVDESYNSAGKYYANTLAAVNLIPVMTAATSPSGVASASSDFGGGYAAWKAFDADPGSWWVAGSASPAWLAYEFPAPSVVAEYIIHSRNDNTANNPTDWTFEGWDGAAWVVLDTQTGQSFTVGQAKSFVFANATSYIKYRLNISAGPASGNPAVGRLEMLPAASVSAMSLVSETVDAEAFTAGDPPVEARLILLHEPLDPTALDTDLIVDGSRDDGVTWTSGSLTLEGRFDVTTNILACTIDLSAQPAGTAMRWRIRTLNAKSQRLHGVWMQWR